MAAGAELIELQMAHENVMNAVKNCDTKEILMECKSFWLTYNSLEFDSGVPWITQTILQYAEEFRAVEETTTLKLSWWDRWRSPKGGVRW